MLMSLTTNSNPQLSRREFRQESSVLYEGAKGAPGGALAEGPVGVPMTLYEEPYNSHPFQLMESSLRKMFIPFVPLGFDLCEVGQEEVILKTGKQASRRTMHFALQSLLALFGKSSAQCPWGQTQAHLATFWEGERNVVKCFCVCMC